MRSATSKKAKVYPSVPGMRRLAKYLDKVWGFGKLVQLLKDGRKSPSVPTASVFLGLFGMFMLRLGSINQLASQFKIPGRWERWVGRITPSGDTIAYALDRIDLELLRKMLWAIAILCKRKKIFKRVYPDIHWVAALDGIETYKSQKKDDCENCLSRRISVNDEYVAEYYHRYVVLQMVGVTPAVFLDVEALKPGETETAAGGRLLERFLERHPRFLDVITLDAFYLQAPFVKKLLKYGLHLVMVLKQENRDLYQDVLGLCAGVPAKVTIAGTEEIRFWDLGAMQTWTQLGREVRVVRSIEKGVTGKKRKNGDWNFQEETKDWLWCVVSPEGGGKPEGELIAKWGHARWDEETRGFCELTQHWHLDHCYRHNANAMLACMIILFLAFTLTTIFFQRNLKGVWKNLARVTLSRLLADDLVLPYDGSFWATAPA
ncbi:MAG: hypothetical protein Q8O90_02500 [Elusimicrobiota bacterium]|nr:hypothetical protein [Elusimicrobiota bacterium]